MDIEYIKRFIAVGECLNFSKAADMLFISQPTLSHSISNLEKKLGAPLFVRSTKSVKLTRAGELFLPAAIEIVNLYQNVINEISHEFHLDSDTLNIGYTGPATDNMFSAWIKTFRQVCPDVKVHMLRYNSSKIEEAFETRAIHLGVLYEKNAADIPGLKYQKVGKEKFQLLVSAAHPLAKRKKVDLAELEEEPFLICERSCSPSYYDRVLAVCERRGLKPKISQTVALVSDIYRLVSADLGVAILSRSETRFYDSNAVKFVDIGDEDDLINVVVMAWKDRLSPPARQFRDIAVKNAAQQHFAKPETVPVDNLP